MRGISRRAEVLAGVAGFTLVVFGAGSGPAVAQTGADMAPAAAPAGADAMEEVVVTARRREERLQEVPVSVTAFSQGALTARAIAASFDLNKAVSGLTVEADSGNPTIPSFAIRGRGTNYGAAAGSVETYFAEVPLSAPFQIPTLAPQFFDLQSLQVLKGPQGTLFGRSTTGGAVVIVPQAPTDAFEGYGRIQGGNYGDVQLEGALNLPIESGKVDLRVAGFVSRRDGYMHTYPGTVNPVTEKVLPAQDYDSVDSTDVRATLRVRPTDDVENSTIFTYEREAGLASSGAGLNILGLGRPNGLGVFFTPGYGTRYSYLDSSLNRPATDIWAVVNTTRVDISEDLTVKNIFGYINSTGYTDQPTDSDGTDVKSIAINGTLIPRPLKSEQTTDEFQLQGKNFDDRFTWIVGGLMDLTREPGERDNINIYDWTYEFGGSRTARFEQNTIDSYGAFLSGTFKLTDSLSFSAGYRHSWDDVKLGTSDANVFTAIAPPLKYYQSSAQGNTYNLTLEYHVDSNMMIYGGYRLGYKRGGFNASQTDPRLASFDPESVDDFSLGIKDDFTISGMRGRINLEGYYDLYHDMQVSYLAFSPGVGLTTVTTNVPDTTFRGFDLEFALEPTQWLTLDGNYSLIDAFNTRWPDPTPGSALDLKSNPVPYTSRNKFSLTARFHTDLPNDLGEVVFAPSVTYQDRFYTGPLGAVLPAATAGVLGQYNQIAHGGGYVPDYTLLDLRFEWNHIQGTALDAAFNVTNLTDKLYFLGNTGNTLQVGAQGNGYGPPRMFSFELTYHF